MEFETLATGYGLIEGPRTDEQNRLYYSDVRGGGVFRRQPDGRIETLIPERKAVGGIALNEGGRGLVHDDAGAGIVLDGVGRHKPVHAGANRTRTTALEQDAVAAVVMDVAGDDVGR